MDWGTEKALLARLYGSAVLDSMGTRMGRYFQCLGLAILGVFGAAPPPAFGKKPLAEAAEGSRMFMLAEASRQTVTRFTVRSFIT